MARKRPKVSLAQQIPPRSGDLEQLFATEGDVEQASGMRLLAVRLDAIFPDPDQPRNTFPEEGLQELSDSIRQDGVIQPIEVTELEPGRYMIVHGERRWRAAQMAELETIPAVVRRRDYDTITRFVRQMVENVQREDLNDVDRAAALIRLRDLMQAALDAEAEAQGDKQSWSSQISWADVGKRLSLSRQRVHQLRQLLSLPEELQDEVRAGRLSERDTRVYQGLAPTQQLTLHQVRLDESLSPAEVKQIAHQLREMPDRSVYEVIEIVRRPVHRAPAGELPPLMVISHGGPTSSTSAALSLSIQYWTSRGFAVLDVNYGGSTGYGRAYRQRLNGQWGIVDVQDCVNGARYLVQQGLADGQRLAIRGGSAGGYTTLSALAFTDTFSVGASYFGISDLVAMTRETHKFESRYLDNLVAPYPEREDIYFARSPINFVDQFSCPLILFQGLEDLIVPPNQAEMIFDALKAKGVPVAYVPFAGEQHGFRRAENVKRALDAELYFYGRIFGFPLADPVEPVAIENLSQ